MLVTLFTDAGHLPTHNVGSWAAWAKCNGRTMRHSGKLRGNVANSTEAELMAIANGLFCMRREFSPEPKSRIIIQTDSTVSIDLIRKGRCNSPKSQEAITAILAMFCTEQWAIDLRHIKGHNGTKDRRSAVNSWCDSECTIHIRELRQELKDEPPIVRQPKLAIVPKDPATPAQSRKKKKARKPWKPTIVLHNHKSMEQISAELQVTSPIKAQAPV